MRLPLLALMLLLPFDGLCPQRVTPGRWVVRHGTLRRGRREYLCDLETRPFGSGAVFHVLAGGRAGRFPLATTASGFWPRDPRLVRDLGLVGARPLEPGQTVEERVRLRLVRRTTVAGDAALLLRVAGYPDGGVHGGHLAVVWNRGAAGYVLSMHFNGPAREGALLRAAAAMSRGQSA